jgi:hypothetical protein
MVYTSHQVKWDKHIGRTGVDKKLIQNFLEKTY